MKRKQVRTLAAAAAALLCLAGAAQAQAQAQPLPQREGPVSYLNGGVGITERAQMDRAAGRYNLRLRFSERRDNELIVGVHLAVLDPAGHQVFTLANAGPLTDLRLPAGRYRVVATAGQRSEAQTVVLQQGRPQDLGFHWVGRMAG
jgi:hypothetical protein